MQLLTNDNDMEWYDMDSWCTGVYAIMGGCQSDSFTLILRKCDQRTEQLLTDRSEQHVYGHTLPPLQPPTTETIPNILKPFYLSFSVCLPLFFHLYWRRYLDTCQNLSPVEYWHQGVVHISLERSFSMADTFLQESTTAEGSFTCSFWCIQSWLKVLPFWLIVT